MYKYIQNLMFNELLYTCALAVLLGTRGFS